MRYAPAKQYPMKKNFALRVDEEVFAALERWAADEFRSVNGQIEWILNEALRKAKRNPKKPLTRQADFEVTQ